MTLDNFEGMPDISLLAVWVLAPVIGFLVGRWWWSWPSSVRWLAGDRLDPADNDGNPALWWPYVLATIGFVGLPLLLGVGFLWHGSGAPMWASREAAQAHPDRRLHLEVSAMTRSEVLPSTGALEEVRRLAGPSAVVLGAARLEGGQHADTWRVDTENPPTSVVVRQFPVGDPGPSRERRVLRALDGLGGMAPVLLASDLNRHWSRHPTSLISWLDGQPDITPTDPRRWARELGRALAAVHTVPTERLIGLPSVFDRSGGSEETLGGPLAAEVRSRWPEVVGSPEVLTHCDYWSGNVLWRDGRLAGIVDWSDGSRGPPGFDLGWCRLDLVLLFDEQIADDLLAAYEAGTGEAVGEIRLWDCWAAARSDHAVGSWVANYLPLGRADLDEHELRGRHAQWTARLRERP